MSPFLSGFLALLLPAYAGAFDSCKYFDASVQPPRLASTPCPEFMPRINEDMPPMPYGTFWRKRPGEREYSTKLYLRKRQGEESPKPAFAPPHQPYPLVVIRFDGPRGTHQINPRVQDYLERAIEEEALGRGAWARAYAEDGLVLAPEDSRLQAVAARHAGENLEPAGLRAAAFDAYANGHRTLELGQPEASPAWLARSLALWPTVDAYGLSAQLAFKLKRFQEALTAADAGLRMAPNDFMLTNVREQAAHELASRAEPEAAAPPPSAPAPVAPVPVMPAPAVASIGVPLPVPPDAPLAAPAAAAPPSPSPRGPNFMPLLLVLAAALLIAFTAWTQARARRKAAVPPWEAATVIGGTSPTPGSARTPRATPPAAPRSYGRYELMKQIGSGGMGVVYEGRENVRGRRVAIKQMRPEIKDDEGARADFRREAEIISRLNHPNIVAFHELVEEEGELLLVFDYVDGRPLSGILREKTRLPVPEAQRIFIQVCEAMSSAHRAHVMHRDLKPSNIMIDERGQALVMDFGIARAAKDTITRLTRIDGSGTPAYMAPEQHLGRFAKASDIYALGVCLYETLTGKLPFPGPDFLAQKERMIFTPPRFHVPRLPPASELLFQITLAADPEKRVADAEELIDSIQRLS